MVSIGFAVNSIKSLHQAPWTN